MTTTTITITKRHHSSIHNNNKRKTTKQTHIHTQKHRERNVPREGKTTKRTDKADSKTWQQQTQMRKKKCIPRPASSQARQLSGKLRERVPCISAPLQLVSNDGHRRTLKAIGVNSEWCVCDTLPLGGVQRRAATVAT